MSLNNATVKLAEEVGYDKVADLAKAAGITSVKATPAMALGAYDATPLDMAAAYTVFSNNGVRLSPTMVKSVRTAGGDPVMNFNADTRQVLDPRVAYVMTDMMEGVINNGLGFSAQCEYAASSHLRRGRPALRTTAGSPDLPQQFALHRLGRLRRL